MSGQTLPPWEIIQGMVSTLQPGFDEQNKNKKTRNSNINIRQETRFHVPNADGFWRWECDDRVEKTCWARLWQRSAGGLHHPGAVSRGIPLAHCSLELGIWNGVNCRRCLLPPFRNEGSGTRYCRTRDTSTLVTACTACIIFGMAVWLSAHRYSSGLDLLSPGLSIAGIRNSEDDLRVILVQLWDRERPKAQGITICNLRCRYGRHSTVCATSESTSYSGRTPYRSGPVRDHRFLSAGWVKYALPFTHYDLSTPKDMTEKISCHYNAFLVGNMRHYGAFGDDTRWWRETDKRSLIRPCPFRLMDAKEMRWKNLHTSVLYS